MTVALQMLRIILFCVTWQVIDSSCPTTFNFVLVRDGECRGEVPYFNEHADKVYDYYVNACGYLNGVNAQPIVIHNDEHQSYWTARVKRDHKAILGLTCNPSTKRWQWVDGTAVDYRPRVYDSKLNDDCTTGCSWYATPAGEWQIVCGSQMMTYISPFCTTQLPPLPVPASDGCDSFEDDTEDGVCIQVSPTDLKWQDAQDHCRSYGANLASIHNLQENSYIRRLAVSRGAVNGLFLGGTASGKGNEFAWVDGSKWDFDYFYPGLPYPGLGDCLSMDTFSSSGQWVNTDCSSKLPFACVRPQVNTPPPSCPTGPWNEGEIISSPGFPYDSSTPCDFILTVAQGKKVQVEANSCCDSLILLDNIVGGNTVANLTGEISNKVYMTKTSNLMRVSWQPNGGVNVRGMQMTFKGV